MDNANFPENQSLDNLSTLPQTEEVSKTGQKLKGRYINFFARVARSIKKADVKEKINNSAAKLRNRSYHKYRKYFLLALGVIIIFVLAFYIGQSSGQGQNTSQDGRPLPAITKARQVLNKEFKFPLKDDKGKQIGELTYKIESAELQDSIIVKGQRANAVKGRTFLIINIKIANNNSQGLQINSKDYIRLSINNQNEWIAADIHNDPVEVQAISTKLTRLGFPIYEADKDLRLQIGEIKGTKETISLKLK